METLVPDQPIHQTFRLTIEWILTVDQGFFKDYKDDPKPFLIQCINISNGEHPYTIQQRIFKHAKQQNVNWSKLILPEFLKDASEYSNLCFFSAVQTDGARAWYKKSDISAHRTFVCQHNIPKTITIKVIK